MRDRERAGEPAITPVAAAIANAVFDATGVRLRESPLTSDLLMLTMKEASAQNTSQHSS